MSDESHLQLTAKDGSSLTGSKARSGLIARGRRDAAVLTGSSSLSGTRRLAEEGDVYAQCALGTAYRYGTGVPQDFVEALRWYRKAAVAGSGHAARWVGFFFYYGVGVAQDYAEAVKWLSKDTPTEFGDAEFCLGNCYFYGLGVQEDRAKAARWLLESLRFCPETGFCVMFNKALQFDASRDDVDHLLSRIYSRDDVDKATDTSAADREAALFEQLLGLTHETAQWAICDTCGEQKELDTPDDGFCSWCRSREKEITEIWNKWGFDRWGRPPGGVWDQDAQSRDALAKLELETHLKELGFQARWIEMWWGFGKQEQSPIRRGQIQALSVAQTINQKWGFDSEGDPAGQDWNHETQRHAALAIEELKTILANLGLPLPDDWPKEWNPNQAYMLNPLEISQGLWPLGFANQRMACVRCGKHKELIYADCICASCADALS